MQFGAVGRVLFGRYYKVAKRSDLCRRIEGETLEMIANMFADY